MNERHPMSERSRNQARNRTLLGLVLLAAAVIVVVFAAAGGSAQSSDAIGTNASSREDAVTDNGASTEIVTASFPTGHDTDEVSASGADPIAPCTLVSKSQAESILGKGVKVSERPQGPTCTYSGSGREIDLVVEKMPLKQLKEGARSAKPVTIRGRRGWCLSYETTSVVIGVGLGRILQATGPCQAGVRFAAVAVSRIH